MKPDLREQRAKRFMLAVIVLGAIAGAYSVLNLQLNQLTIGFWFLAVITLSLGSRVIVQIPRVKGQISVSDTFIMLTMLLFGSEPAVILAGFDALVSSFRITKKNINIAFNTSVFMLSTFLTTQVVKGFFGKIPALTAEDFSPAFLMALTIMGTVQYLANSGLVATAVAMKSGEPIWITWRDKFLWTSLTYFAGASAAGVIAKMSESLGFFAFIAIAPIIAIIYFTYNTYLKNVETSTQQAEQAQAHVEELSQHIAEQERIARALKESEEHFRTAFDHAVGMALVSLDGFWIQVNDSLCNLLGYLPDELPSKSIRSITHEEDLGKIFLRMRELTEGLASSFQIEVQFIHKNGETVWVILSASLVYNEDGSPRHQVFQIQDISDRKRAETQIHFAAFHDALTSLPNRTLLSDRMSMAVERAKRMSDYQFAVLFIDLDRFKLVNDSMGHEMGDKLLKDLSSRLVGCVRAVDTVARLGGDEFAILLDDTHNHDFALEVATRIQESILAPFDLDGQEFFTTASIGIAFSSLGYDKPEDILRDADTAMYRAKANGKARHEIFDLGMHVRAVELLQLENDLRRAIEKKEVYPFFQPIVSLSTDLITGFEALARWEHPEKGIISPIDFIELAEETGLILPLGMSILRESCLQLKKWQQRFKTNKPLTMSVNLSAKQFAQKDLVEEIRNVLRETDLDPASIRLELTESIVMGNALSSIEMLTQLKSIGVQLAIDDFGTGYSSLSYLNRFPIDILKIDRSFVSRMATDKDSRGIVKTIVALAKELGKELVAEGVENEKHKIMLANLSCDYAQGYFFSKPLSAKDAEEFLRNNLENAVSSSVAVFEANRNTKTIKSKYLM